MKSFDACVVFTLTIISLIPWSQCNDLHPWDGSTLLKPSSARKRVNTKHRPVPCLHMSFSMGNSEIHDQYFDWMNSVSFNYIIPLIDISWFLGFLQFTFPIFNNNMLNWDRQYLSWSFTLFFFAFGREKLPLCLWHISGSPNTTTHVPGEKMCFCELSSAVFCSLFQFTGNEEYIS